VSPDPYTFTASTARAAAVAAGAGGVVVAMSTTLYGVPHRVVPGARALLPTDNSRGETMPGGALVGQRATTGRPRRPRERSTQSRRMIRRCSAVNPSPVIPSLLGSPTTQSPAHRSLRGPLEPDQRTWPAAWLHLMLVVSVPGEGRQSA
jgi:hypothetical protein